MEVESIDIFGEDITVEYMRDEFGRIFIDSTSLQSIGHACKHNADSFHEAFYRFLFALDEIGREDNL